MNICCSFVFERVCVRCASIFNCYHTAILQNFREPLNVCVLVALQSIFFQHMMVYGHANFAHDSFFLRQHYRCSTNEQFLSLLQSRSGHSIKIKPSNWLISNSIRLFPNRLQSSLQTLKCDQIYFELLINWNVWNALCMASMFCSFNVLSRRPPHLYVCAHTQSHTQRNTANLQPRNS